MQNMFCGILLTNYIPCFGRVSACCLKIHQGKICMFSNVIILPCITNKSYLFHYISLYYWQFLISIWDIHENTHLPHHYFVFAARHFLRNILCDCAKQLEPANSLKVCVIFRLRLMLYGWLLVHSCFLFFLIIVSVLCDILLGRGSAFFL